MPSELVVDASAIVKALVEPTEQAYELGKRLGADTVHAPHLVDAEVGNVLRRLVLAGRIEADTGLTGLVALDGLVDTRYPHHGPVVHEAWALRHRIRFYDALYVALAAKTNLHLMTADVRLSRAPDLPCAVEVV